MSSPVHALTQPLAGLRSLRVLRAAYNHLTHLDSLGRWASSLEVLDVGYNRLTSVASLAHCTALSELNLEGTCSASLTHRMCLSKLGLEAEQINVPMACCVLETPQES